MIVFTEWESIDRGEIIDPMRVERGAMTGVFTEWESIDCSEIIDPMIVEREAMTRALVFIMIVSCLGSYLRWTAIR